MLRSQNLAKQERKIASSAAYYHPDVRVQQGVLDWTECLQEVPWLCKKIADTDPMSLKCKTWSSTDKLIARLASMGWVSLLLVLVLLSQLSCNKSTSDVPNQSASTLVPIANMV